ncbi:ABC transporter permease [Candidatus Sumerlaeota bacterium]|nr:ABC transporter permease [Candidatus Sumerlaeota bacterium]
MKRGFSTTRLVLRSLAHYWRIHLAVASATAVGVAVLAGSLVVGDSVRASLRRLALDRLGRIDRVLTGEAFFRQELTDAFSRACPAILVEGSVVDPNTGTRASRVNVVGVPAAFWTFWDAQAPWTSAGSFDVALNRALADEIEVDAGGEVLVRVQKPSAVSRETLLGRRDDTVATMRFRVARILPDEGAGRFGLVPTQQYPRNVYVPLRVLQRRIEREGRIDTILLPPLASDPQEILNRVATLEDMGLRLTERGGFVSLESDRVFLRRPEIEAAREASRDVASSSSLTLAYVVNAMRAGERAIPYSVVAAAEDAVVEEGHLLLNRWAADDLRAAAGDRVGLTYWVPGADDRLEERTTTLTIAGVLEMSDPLVNDALVPEFPGISDAESLSSWDPPFPIDVDRIRPRDEEYWDEYRAAPKALVSIQTGRSLWANRHGDATSARWREGTSVDDLRRALRARLDPARSGLAFQPVRDAALGASRGASDFGGLFVGFSLFILVSSALLIGILFRLNVDSRAADLGLLGAVGFAPRAIRRLMWMEGGVVAGVGALVGTLGGWAFAAGMVHGLRTWWVGSVGTPFVVLAVSPVSLIGGALGGWLVAMFSVWQTSRRVLRAHPRTLLEGGSASDRLAPGGRRRVAFVVGIASLVLGGATAVASLGASVEKQAILFFATGALGLTGCLAFLSAWLARPSAIRADRLRVTRLGMTGARRRPARSLLVAGLVSCAAFLIVSVGANRRVAGSNGGKQSGTGGFTLLAESALPLYAAIDPSRLEGGRAYRMRLRPGDDASCLNLYRAARPRILGVGDDFIDRGGFAFSGVLDPSPEEKSNPWLLLRRPLPDGAVPAVADYTTAVWLLHSGLGKDIEVDGTRYRLVALLARSVFQSGLMISEENFERLFPEAEGYRSFAIETPRGAGPRVARRLESEFGDYGFDAIEASETLNRLMVVENTYLSIFQSLGGLGLLLGTVGLALALARNLIERQSEFALMRALGFRLRTLVWLAVSENALLLVFGIAAGTVWAVVAVLPPLVARLARPPWIELSVEIAAILLFGLLAAGLCALVVLRLPALRALKRER